MVKMEQPKKRLEMPHVFVVLILVFLFIYLLTFIIPKGNYERVETEGGHPSIVPGSFEFISAPYVGFFDMIQAIPLGMAQAGELIFGGLMIGALFKVLEKTGMITVAIAAIKKFFHDRTILLIPTLMLPLAIFTTITGVLELNLLYIPIVVPLFLRLGYDRLTAFATVILGSASGFIVAISAPTTVGLAQTISGLPLYSGLGFRLVVLILFLLGSIVYVMYYANKVHRNPEISPSYQDGKDAYFLKDEISVTVNARHYIGFVFLAFATAFMIYGLLQLGWYFIELGAWYLFMAIVIAAIFSIRPSEMAELFHEGFKLILLAGIVIGLSRSISILLEQGMITDTIVYGLETIMQGTPSGLAAILMVVVQTGFNFFVGSGSGQALITMPIMSSLSELIGVTQQTSVLAFQFGDGISNLYYPVGLILAFLALARVSYFDWLKFLWPLLVYWYGIVVVSLFLADFIQL